MKTPLFILSCLLCGHSVLAAGAAVQEHALLPAVAVRKLTASEQTLRKLLGEGAHGVANLIPQRVKSGFPPAKWPELLLDWLKTALSAPPDRSLTRRAWQTCE
jgi:hypothetical protein